MFVYFLVLPGIALSINSHYSFFFLLLAVTSEKNVIDRSEMVSQMAALLLSAQSKATVTADATVANATVADAKMADGENVGGAGAEFSVDDRASAYAIDVDVSAIEVDASAIEADAVSIDMDENSRSDVMNLNTGGLAFTRDLDNGVRLFCCFSLVLRL